MPRYALLLLLLLSAFTRTSVGGLPANCATPTKKLKAMAKKFYDPTKAGEVFCPLRENPIEHLEKSFANIAGQDSARKTIRAALVKNIKLGKGPLVFHIAGPSGVGKSLTARAVARAMMESTGDDTPQDQWCGVSVINGHYYASREPSRIRKDGRVIMDQIGTQLASCPRSVVIMDDIQHMDARLLQSLATVFDDAFPHVHLAGTDSDDVAATPKEGGPTEVSTAAAIFILVSDLGEAALDPAMTRSQATEAVRNATRNHWPGAKLPKFVSDVVPFQPLSLAEMAMVAQLELEKYRDELKRDNIFYIDEEQTESWDGELTWSTDVPAFIASQVARTEFLHEIQGRGVQQRVQSAVDDAWDEREEAHDIGRFDNLHLSVREGGGLVSAPDRILDGESFNRDAGHHAARGDAEL